MKSLDKKLKEKIIGNKIIGFGVIISVLYLFIEAIIDTYGFKISDNIFQDIFSTEIHEQFMHILVIVLILLTSISSQILIIKQKRIEQKLKDSEEKFRNISQQSLVGICIIQDNLIKYANQRYADIGGYSVEEMINWKSGEFEKIVHPEDREMVMEQSVKKQKGLSDFTSQYQFRALKKTRETIWVEILSNTIFYEGKPAVLISIIDISEKKKTDQKLKESEEKYRLTFENASDAIFWADPETSIIINCNKMAEKILEKNKEEIIGQQITSIHPLEYTDYHALEFENVTKGNLNVNREISLVSNSGKIIPTLVTDSEVVIEGKSIIQGIFKDISERKKAEDKIKEQKEFLTNIIESISQPFYVINANDYTIEMANSAANFGKLSSSSTCYALTHHNDRPCKGEHICPLEEVKKTRRHVVVEHVHYDKDGNVINFEIHGYPILDDNGNVIHMIEYAYEITERKLTEQKLKELSKLKSEFLRRASHELKTPLISIKGFSDLILSLYADQLDPVILSKLREINDGCIRLQNIINNLLKTSRLQTPDLKPKVQKEDLSFLIKFCVHELESLAETRKQSIKLDVHSELYANIEKEEIHDVISNLLTNAINYTPPNGKIEIKTELREDSMVVSVKDNGIGFTKEQKTKIFQQFGKIERYGQGLDLGIGGTGLGLYISKKIVESHGGKIWMESEGKSKGSTFYFTLPTVK